MSTRRWKDIFEASENNDIAAVRDFVKEQPSCVSTAGYNNQTAAHFAARSGNLDILKFLFEKDPSLLTTRDAFNYHVLHRAAERGMLHIVKYLIDEMKVDIYDPVNDSYGNTVLHVAAAAGEMQVIKYLIEEKKMDPNLQNHLGQPPPFSAATNKHLNVVRYFVEKLRVDLTVIDKKNEHILFTSVIRRDMKIPRYLLDDRKLKVDINQKGNHGRTLIFHAARIDAIRFAKYYVEEKEADVNIADDNGRTPLHQAAQSGNFKVVKLLVQNKAKFRTTDKQGKTALDLATFPPIISYLEIIMARRGRKSRSISKFSIPGMPPSILLPHNKELPPILNDVSSSGVDRVLMLGSTEHRKIGAPPQANSFLIFADICLRFCKGLRYQPSKQRFLLSVKDMMEERIDPVAIESVSTIPMKHIM